MAAWAIAFGVVVGPRSSTVNAAYIAPLRVPIGRGAVAADSPEAARAGAAAPAVKLARDGFAANEHLASAASRILGRLGANADEPLRALLAPGGKPLAAGDRIKRAELARTLEAFGRGGAPAFYRGAIA